jgi:hypothetical protein
MANDAEFADVMNDWLKQVEKTANPDQVTRTAITGAGAAVFAEQLKQDTPRSNIDYSVGKSRQAGHAKKRKTKHLQDSITYTPGSIVGGVPTGDTDVGFENHYFDFVARITNDGRKKMSPKEQANQHFADRAMIKSQPVIAAAMAAAFKAKVGGA